MMRHLDSDQEQSPVVVQWLHDLVVFRGASRPLFCSTDLVLRDAFLAELQQCDQSDDVRVVVLAGFPEKTGRGEYEAFYRAALTGDNRLALRRMLNVFNQLILAIVQLSKPVIFVDGGRILSQFFNVGLACDYRILSSSTVIERAYLRHGMLPKGGGAWFLSKVLGRHRAFQLLLSDGDVTAQRARELGLVDEVVPDERLNEAGLAAARRFSALPASTVGGIKRLLRFDLAELSDYLAMENDEILKAASSSDLAAVGWS